jgi:hypothetical protein
MDIPRYGLNDFGHENWRVPDVSDVHREFMSSREEAVPEATEVPYVGDENGSRDLAPAEGGIQTKKMESSSNMKKFFDPDFAKSQFFALAKGN